MHESVPTSSAMRRSLARARDGKSLDVGEAAVLLAARGDDLEQLCVTASRVRDQGLIDAAREGLITYSKKVFIPLTRLCRDRCHYCTFATVPGRVPSAYLSIDEVLEIARQGAAMGCKEALFTLGDRPEDRWEQARAWLDEAGYDDTLSYVRACAIAVLEETGLLPHLNPGVMTWSELQRLKPVAPSMGMMLETTARVHAHDGSPDKDPEVRLRVLEDAGRQSVPFTTGLLVGIGETLTERAETIFAIRRSHRLHGHVQEVIVQNFRAKPDTAMRSVPDVELDEFLAAVAVTRVVMGPRMRVQAPPNLVDLDQTRRLIAAGVDDFGGISPLTPDHVNPERPWPEIEALAQIVDAAGFTLRERLTAHPPYLREPWLDPRLSAHVAALAGPDGLAADVTAEGRPWQEPDGGLAQNGAGTGRTDLHASIDTVGRTTDRRGDFDEVYGDWAAVKASVPTTVKPLGSDVAAALRVARDNPSALSDEQALALITADGADLEAVCALADDVRRDTVGDDVTYVVNRNINFTNVCYTGCRFCAFAQRRTDADAYSLSLSEVADRAREAWAVGATEVCMQGGIDPALPGTAYLELAQAVKSGAPGLHLHAYSPMEVVNGAARMGVSISEFLVAAREAGVDSLPGTAAEILDDEVRWVLTKGKLPTAQWIEVVTSAHRLGIPTTSTMMYGHVDQPHHWIGHLRVLRNLQGETGGFTEFVPLPFVHNNAPIYLAGVARPGPTVRDNRAVHAVARLMLHERIDHIQCSWVKLGPEECTRVIHGGVDDLGGTLMEETISRMAGSMHGSRKSVEELETMVRGAGRTPRQRTTTYGTVDDERLVAARR
ncbi:FO synthase subunit 1 /FO synthase subunit 2 [Antricoccus suffuscus]|uniref:FO synthase n=1 Tax=Antricoccus suffuscus TaxID=1629062 RepID=A0A2T0ZB45_9ACTN|nr:bifunctional FO biosynthesis protein CofGH [Antricoccus suffuscus]PRZ33563.1 FO synthase subunit 1 /FO synthase subunit 2 [Antricoccus suffuscus]